MTIDPGGGFIRQLTWNHVALLVTIVFVCNILVLLFRRILRVTAERTPVHRLAILRFSPIARLIIWIVGCAVAVPILVEPTFGDVAALLATLGLGAAFALRDYASCLVAGIVTIVENTYQPGDWIQIGGVYGEVRKIGMRTVHLVTADDDDVFVPHSKIWTESVLNDSSGTLSILCVTDFYLEAAHDGSAVIEALNEIALSSPFRRLHSPIKIVASEKPFGTHYRLKTYVSESREQFTMITDLTVRAKKRFVALGIPFARTLVDVKG